MRCEIAIPNEPVTKLVPDPELLVAEKRPVPEIVGRQPDLAIGTPSSVTRTPARAELSAELFSYAFASAPRIVSALARTGDQ